MNTTDIVILGPGRCGSSALASTFVDTGVGFDCGEVGELMFDLYCSIRDSLPALGVTRKSGVSQPELPRFFVAHLLDFLFEGRDTAHRVFKPVGYFARVREAVAHHGLSDSVDFYVSVIDSVFPQAHTILLIREPSAWIRSAVTRWGLTVTDAIASLRFYAALVDRASDAIDLIDTQEFLRQQPRRFVERNLPFLSEAQQSDFVRNLETNEFARNVRSDDAGFSLVCRPDDMAAFEKNLREIYASFSSHSPSYTFDGAGQCLIQDLLQLPSESSVMTDVSAGLCEEQLEKVWKAKVFIERENIYLKSQVVEKNALIDRMQAWILELQRRLDIR